VTISGLPPALKVGQTAQLTASVTLSDGAKKDATSSVAWQSSEPSVATVSATGLLTTTGAGEAFLTATLQGVKGTAKLAVSQLVPPPVSYEVSGVVHETAPTEAVLLSDVLVQVVGGQLDGHQVSTNANGVFVLPPVTAAGFSLRVKKAGYETVQVPVAALPHHLTHSLGLSPLAQQVHEQWMSPCCRTLSIPLVRFAISVHHSGKLELYAVTCGLGCTDADIEQTCTRLQDEQGNLIAQHRGAYGIGVDATIDVTGGHRYELTVSRFCDSPSRPPSPSPPRNIVDYYVAVTHPN
jgi:hypothetical protein